MVKAHDVREQLRRIGADYRFWGVSELRELPKILFDNEIIQHVTNGRYSGGFATMCATDHRVLLIDKKPLYLTLEDIRYDMVSDVMFNHRLLNASLILGTIRDSISFIGFNKTKLRLMTNYIQERVMAYRRQQQMMQTHPEQLPVTEQLFEAVPVPDVPQFEASYQPQPLPAAPTQPLVSTAIDPAEPVRQYGDVPMSQPINPYKMSFTVRRRTGRFF